LLVVGAGLDEVSQQSQGLPLLGVGVVGVNYLCSGDN
jgi:hypothetical protein